MFECENKLCSSARIELRGIERKRKTYITPKFELGQTGCSRAPSAN